MRETKRRVDLLFFLVPVDEQADKYKKCKFHKTRYGKETRFNVRTGSDSRS